MSKGKQHFWKGGRKFQSGIGSGDNKRKRKRKKNLFCLINLLYFNFSLFDKIFLSLITEHFWS